MTMTETAADARTARIVRDVFISLEQPVRERNGSESLRQVCVKRGETAFVTAEQAMIFDTGLMPEGATAESLEAELSSSLAEYQASRRDVGVL
jgi:hypothetical protein